MNQNLVMAIGKNGLSAKSVLALRPENQKKKKLLPLPKVQDKMGLVYFKNDFLPTFDRDPEGACLTRPYVRTI